MRVWGRFPLFDITFASAQAFKEVFFHGAEAEAHALGNVFVLEAVSLAQQANLAALLGQGGDGFAVQTQMLLGLKFFFETGRDVIERLDVVVLDKAGDVAGLFVQFVQGQIAGHAKQKGLGLLNLGALLGFVGAQVGLLHHVFNVLAARQVAGEEALKQAAVFDEGDRQATECGRGM